MLKYFLMWFLIFATGISKAADRDIDFYVGHANGGLAANFSTVMSQSLEQRGWKINYKIIGNCGQVKNLMTTSSRPTLATWQASWNIATNVCHHELEEKYFIDILLDSPRLLCGPVGVSNYQLQPGQTYRVGTNPGQYHGIMLQSLAIKLGIEFKVIEYKNSGHIARAMQAKEIDLWYTNLGLIQHRAGTQKCFYGTFAQDTNDITALSELIEGDRAFASFMAYLFVNDKFTAEQKKQLLTDVRIIIESPAYKDLLLQGGNTRPEGTKTEQINMIKRNARSFTKPDDAN